MKLRGLFWRQDDATVCDSLYGIVVARARRPEFYTTLGVPDTVDGRFDMIAIHAFLLLRRLKREGSDASSVLAQSVFDLMFADMDRNLREMGVSDLAVGRKVKQMAKALYGRIAVYEDGLADRTGTTLEDALGRNLYRGCPVAAEQVAAVAAYMRREALALDAQGYAELAAGRLSFADPIAPAGGGGDG